MAFLMGKVVAGPNIGNVGEILTEMGNPTFDVNDNDSAVDAILQSLDLANKGKGLCNHDYAMKHFSTELFCKKLHEIFEDCM